MSPSTFFFEKENLARLYTALTTHLSGDQKEYWSLLIIREMLKRDGSTFFLKIKKRERKRKKKVYHSDSRRIYDAPLKWMAAYGKHQRNSTETRLYCICS